MFNRQLLKKEILFTEACLKQLKVKKGLKEDAFLRLSVEAGEGCKGFKYDFRFDSTLEEDDVLLGEEKDTLFAIDFMTLQLIEGATIDYSSSMIRSAFEVMTNPNADSSCSCKISFSPKDSILD
jgi:iron-sulfur cluster assembly accessory protein